MGKDGFLLFLQNSIAVGIANLDSSRVHNTSLEKRKEGWTEKWGSSAAHFSSDDLSLVSTATHPQSSVMLYQFRPAWTEQLLLSLCRIDFVVINSKYAATESTGALPYLRSNQTLVGVSHPNSSHPGNDILRYLKEQNPMIDAEVSAPEQQRHSQWLITMMDCQLKPIIQVLRFQDSNAWEQVYRPQYVAASSRFQAWSCRVVSTNQYGGAWTVGLAKETARDCFATLESQLKDSLFLLGTTKPTSVDALLFGHLAEALCDVHLVTILVDYPNLVKFFQSIYDTYFRLPENPTDTLKWNYRQNYINPFQQLPIIPRRNQSFKGEGGTTNFSHALELMESLSAHQHKLEDVLQVAQSTAASQIVPQNRQKGTLFRLRMGGDIQTDNEQEDEAKQETPEQKKWRKDHKHNDEVWITAVIGFTVLAFVLAQPQRSS